MSGRSGRDIPLQIVRRRRRLERARVREADAAARREGGKDRGSPGNSSARERDLSPLKGLRFCRAREFYFLAGAHLGGRFRI